jgi:hypothetical protein
VAVGSWGVAGVDLALSGYRSVVVVYEFAWRTVCGLLGAVGIALACIVLPADVMVAIVTVAAVVGAMTAVGHLSTTPTTDPSPGLGRSAMLGAMASTAVIAIAGFAVILNIGVIGMVLILAVSSPQTLRWCNRQLRAAPRVEAELLTISTAELCRQWQATYDSLRSATTPAVMLRIVEARQRCLDELERRDPSGLNAWLASAASAAGDPSSFLTGHSPDRPPTDQ